MVLMPQSVFSFARQNKKTEVTSEHVARIGWLLLRLILDRAVEYATYRDHFGCSKRAFQRDLRELRAIGTQYFTIGSMKGGRVLMSTDHAGLRQLHARSRDATATLARIAIALGGPIQHVILDPVGESAHSQVDLRSGFLQVREPSPNASHQITKTFEFLNSAAAGPARVEFAYHARGIRTMRRAEPYHVIARLGRYYLIGYDLGRRDWRQFALDAIDKSTLRKEGTFSPRTVPAKLLAERAVGWIQAHGNAQDVTIHMSPLVAASVGARTWQQEQRIITHHDGSLDITLSVDDLAEAVRWSLQFGSEALVIAPPQAVALARETTQQILQAYAESRHTAVAQAV